MRIFWTFLTLLSFIQAHASSDYHQWFRTAHSAKKGQALVIHGLNTKPEKMKDIIDEFNKRGHDVLLLRLLGHHHDLEQMKKVTRSKWVEQIQMGLEELEKRHLRDGGKKTFVGYSLGAVVGLSYLCELSEKKFDQMILFSPALRVRWSSHLIKLSFILGDEFVIKSFSPESYRAQPGTTVAAYRGLFESIDRLNSSSHQLLNIPARVLMDPNDELVSFAGIQDFARPLSEWRIIPVSNEKSLMKKTYHHLTITPEVLGTVEWETRVSPVFNEFLGSLL
jgi:esterase/lipase